MDNFIRSFIAKYSRIIRRSSRENLLKLVSAIEYTEAILEITAGKLFGNKFKWFVIFITHLAKCIIRLQLLIVHKFGVQPLQSLFTLTNFLGHNGAKNLNTNRLELKGSETSFKLKHSGRVIRTINSSPVNLEDRKWTNPGEETTKKEENLVEPADITQEKNRLIAEILHIMRPICHLTTMFFFNSKSWLQFMVPLLMDTFSLFLMNGTHNMNQEQKKEMRRRAWMFLNYFIRSPLYESYSYSILNVILSQMEQRLPGAKYITRPINTYIPQWREVYNYCWSV